MKFVPESRSFHELHGFRRAFHVALGFGDELVQVSGRHRLHDGVGHGKGNLAWLGPVIESTE